MAAIRAVVPRAKRLIANVDDRARGYEQGKLLRIPIGQMHAAVGYLVSDLRWIGRAVNAIVRLAEAEPDDADRIVRSRRNLRFGVMGLGAADPLRVVSEVGIFDLVRDLEPAGRNLIATDDETDRELRDQSLLAIEHLQDAL